MQFLVLLVDLYLILRLVFFYFHTEVSYQIISLHRNNNYIQNDLLDLINVKVKCPSSFQHQKKVECLAISGNFLNLYIGLFFC